MKKSNTKPKKISISDFFYLSDNQGGMLILGSRFIDLNQINPFEFTGGVSFWFKYHGSQPLIFLIDILAKLQITLAIHP